MKIFTSIQSWLSFWKNQPTHKISVGFVPTLGNIHQGHCSLMRQAVLENDVTILSIYLNPTQFDDPDDLYRYPKTFENDIELACSEKIDYILAPKENELYPDNYCYKIEEGRLSQQQEGAYRPGMFSGVLTVVLKLFQLIRPNKAYFGEKDYQQLQLIKGMVTALFINIEIIACPTVRDKDGLALSSRNQLLSNEHQKLAPYLYKILHSGKSIDDIIYQLSQKKFKVDYVDIFQERLVAAARLGRVRLIDNIPLSQSNIND